MKKIIDILIPSIYLVITMSTYAIEVIITSYESDEMTVGNGIDINYAYNDKSLPASKILDISCKSPCPSTAEMCIQMCA